jgi:hypothetical protein
MAATRFLRDDVIEAIVHDRPVDPVYASLVAFARSVRALGDGPAPRASEELVALLEHGLGATIVSPNGADAWMADPSRSVPATVAGVAGRVAGLGVVAKVALGTAVAAAGVGAAGAAGVLPAAAGEAVRHAIEAVSPIDFGGHDDDPGATDPAPGSTGTSGDTTGSDEPTIADDTTGADHRPDPGAVDEPPGQSGDTGLTRADETPAAPHAPDSTPAATTPAATAPGTIPPTGPPDQADQDGQGGAPESAPSTVPAPRGDRADGHASGT